LEIIAGMQKKNGEAHRKNEEAHRKNEILLAHVMESIDGLDRT
jgi:hypothetical protein